MPHRSFRRRSSSGVDDVDVEVVPDGVVVVVGVLLDAGVALPHAVRAQPRVAPLQARAPAVPEGRFGLKVVSRLREYPT